jgi:hypothetical protein
VGSRFWISGCSRLQVPERGRAIAFAVAVLLTAGACASRVVPPPRSAAPATAVTGFSFATDTFDFRNDIRARDPDKEDLYANYCFVLARGLRQFFAFARFDPSAPRLDSDGYAARIRDVVARPPWNPPLAAGERVVIPGYADLRALSRGEEGAVKAALGGRFWTWIHWSNWRVVFPVTAGHQGDVARAIMDEVAAGRLVQLLVTNWPKHELNHTVVAFEFHEETDIVEFAVWDPNDPAAPGQLTFDRRQRRFVATRLYDTEIGIIRVFRMYYSPWL